MSIQPPARTTAVAGTTKQLQIAQCLQIVSQGAIRQLGLDGFAYSRSWHAVPRVQKVENPPLPLRQIVIDSVRRNIPARNEPYHHITRSFLELWTRMPGRYTQFDDLLRSSPPTLDQTNKASGAA